MILYSILNFIEVETEGILSDLLAVGQSIFFTNGYDYAELDSYFPILIDRLDNQLT